MTGHGNALRIPAPVAEAIAAHVAGYGRSGVETGGFLMADPKTGVLAVMAMAGEVGVVRDPDLFLVSSRAMDRLFSYAESRGLWVAAQVHSHGGRAFLSRTDREHGVAVEGFTTVVVPNFGAPSADPEAWGWWRYQGGAWLHIPAPAVMVSPVECVVFDELGVRGA